MFTSLSIGDRSCRTRVSSPLSLHPPRLGPEGTGPSRRRGCETGENERRSGCKTRDESERLANRLWKDQKRVNHMVTVPHVSLISHSLITYARAAGRPKAGHTRSVADRSLRSLHPIFTLYPLRFFTGFNILLTVT